LLVGGGGGGEGAVAKKNKKRIPIRRGRVPPILLFGRVGLSKRISGRSLSLSAAREKNGLNRHKGRFACVLLHRKREELRGGG